MTTDQGAREALVGRIAEAIETAYGRKNLTFVARAVLPLVDAEVAAAVSEAQAEARSLRSRLELAGRTLTAERAAAGWDMRGGSLNLSREEWGVIIDALIQHRGHAEDRKAVNSESASDVRAAMCADLIGRLNAAASSPAATTGEAGVGYLVIDSQGIRREWSTPVSSGEAATGEAGQ